MHTPTPTHTHAHARMHTHTHFTASNKLFSNQDPILLLKELCTSFHSTPTTESPFPDGAYSIDMDSENVVESVKTLCTKSGFEDFTAQSMDLCKNLRIAHTIVEFSFVNCCM